MGRIIKGQAVLLARHVPAGGSPTYWIGAETPDGSFWWVREDLLRPRGAYEAQQQREGGETS
jgi:hypothetical protein